MHVRKSITAELRRHPTVGSWMIGLQLKTGKHSRHGVMSVWSVLVFPALFTAGMTLMDTTESLLMVNAYGWASAKPIRKLYYNLTTTATSIIVAVLVGDCRPLI
jgi:high-affinity nickel permease